MSAARTKRPPLTPGQRRVLAALGQGPRCVADGWADAGVAGLQDLLDRGLLTVATTGNLVTASLTRTAAGAAAGADEVAS